MLAGRAFLSLEEMDAAFAGWAVLRRTQVHRTHQEVIGVRAAADHAALRPLPASRYLVAEQHRAGRQGLPDLVRGQHVLGAGPSGAAVPAGAGPGRDGKVAIDALPGDGGGLLAAHARAARRGSFVVDEAHWDGLPTVTPAPSPPARRRSRASTRPARRRGTGARAGALEMLLASRPAANAPVAPAAERLPAGHLARHAARRRLTRAPGAAASPLRITPVRPGGAFPLFPVLAARARRPVTWHLAGNRSTQRTRFHFLLFHRIAFRSQGE